MKKLNLFVSLITICFLLTGCLRSNSTGVMKGFVEFSGRVSIGITSDICDFNADDVKLTIHYGVSETLFKKLNNSINYDGLGNCEYLGIAIFAYEASYVESFFGKELENYKQLKNVHILKEVTKEELLTGKYNYKTKSTFGEWAEVIFSVKEEMVIPREVFLNKNGNFDIVVTTIEYSKLENKYVLGSVAGESFSYNYTDENKIKLT